jgi:hypothetical protein
MGAPRLETQDHLHAVPMDLQALTAPRAARSPEVQIDRVMVTVQAAPTAPVAAAVTPAMGPESPVNRPPAGGGRTYRNPWAGYYSRRD